MMGVMMTMTPKINNAAGSPVIAPGREIKRLPPWLYPLTAERRYVADLTAWTVSVCASIREEIGLTLPGIIMQRDLELGINRGDAGMGWGWLESLSSSFKKAIPRAIQSVRAKFNLRDIARKVSETNKRQWHRILRKQYRVDVIKSESWLEPRLIEWERRNIALIESIPADYVQRLEGKIIDAVQRGMTAKQVTAIVLNVYPLPKARARLIARDQVGKLNGQLTQLRQEALGVKEYIWRGVMDSRERASHVAHEKKRYLWDKPPKDTGHPGEDYQCRCTAEPVLPMFEDIDWS